LKAGRRRKKNVKGTLLWLPEKDKLISSDANLIKKTQHAGGFFLLFPARSRPCTDDVDNLLSASAQIINRSGAGEGWLELLAGGLSFDLHGLTPAESCFLPRASHFYGLSADVKDVAVETIALYPGPHLADGPALVPVVRIMAGLACELALKLNALAVSWQPAGSWMSIGYFVRLTQAWHRDGLFPALGLTGTERLYDGSVETDGLSFFVGQELRLKPGQFEPAASTIKLAISLIDQLVRNGPLVGNVAMTGIAGERISAKVSPDSRYITITRERELLRA
jgi:hypothetical protein